MAYLFYKKVSICVCVSSLSTPNFITQFALVPEIYFNLYLFFRFKHLKPFLLLYSHLFLSHTNYPFTLLFTEYKSWEKNLGLSDFAGRVGSNSFSYSYDACSSFSSCPAPAPTTTATSLPAAKFVAFDGTLPLLPHCQVALHGANGCIWIHSYAPSRTQTPPAPAA